MTPERWQRVRELLERALSLKPEQRTAFLDRHCSSDQFLRREVETLLASSDDVRSNFLKSAPQQAPLISGTKLGEYEVKSLLGAGGMGEVYRARDVRLGRNVAIKVLPAFLSADADRLRRFEQEARSAAALNHPNILAVFQMGTYEGAPYLVSELLEGETLRECIKRGHSSVRKTVDYGVQIAHGLGAAHEKGIVHRDLKPENLFVTRDGRVKILDFGLAKIKQVKSASEPNAPTLTEGTEAGVVLGTVGYMAPEQVRGQTADHRADIFALGAILYEMLAGKRAFQKPTSAETMTAILNEDPPGISQVAINVPPALQRVVHRCLEKNAEQRFQSASDLAFALDGLSNSGELALPEAVSKRMKGAGKRRNTIVIGVMAVLAFLLGDYFYSHRTQVGAKWVQITDFADSATSPALSPDGRMIAFIRGPETFVTPGQIYVKLLPDGQPVQLTRDSSPKMAPAFSPDGSRIAYTATDASFGWNTWVVPVLGGEPQELLPNAAALTWIARQHVMFSEIKTGIHMGISTSTESRAEERDVYLPTEKIGMAHRSWLSPDGKWVLISEMDTAGPGWGPCRVVPFDASTSGETAGPKGARCTYAGWSLDGKAMYFSADAGDGFHIWRQQFPGGTPEQITFGATEEEGIAVSPDGRSIVTSAGIRQSTIWLHDSRGDRQISGEGYASLPGLGYGPSEVRSVFSPDGKQLFYLLRRQGSGALISGELWKTELDSGRTDSVLPGISMTEFDIAPDGNRVVFSTLDARGTSDIWLASLDHRTPPKQLTSYASDRPRFGPGGWVYFQAPERDSNQASVYSIGPGDAETRQINRGPIPSLMELSPHGDWWLSLALPVTARPTRGGSPIRVCNFCGVGWDPSGKYLYLRFRGVGEMGGGKTVVIGLPPGKDLPWLPPSGLNSADDVKRLNVVAEIDMTDKTVFAPGPNPSIYAYARMTVQRNLFRIPLE